MAAPIGHIYLALKLLAGPLQGVDMQEFVLGTSFPDIRYWAHVPREYTHLPVNDFNEILQEPSAFRAGMLFHSFVDNQRYNYFAKKPAIRIANIIDYNGFLMKTVEDIILFPLIRDKISDKNFISYFDTILPEENLLIGNSTLINQWHTLLQNYFKEGPTLGYLNKTFHPTEQPSRLKQIGAAIFYALSNRLAAMETIQKNVIAFYNNFDAIAQKASGEQIPSSTEATYVTT
jgi:hypothetical protein